jgi:hypothetical protein
MGLSTDSTVPVEQRLWGRISEAGECWLYTGYLTPYGYGQLSYQNRQWLAHRLAWFLTHGAIPEDKLVCHTCDTRACVRPEHLYVGSYADNNRDTRTRGRHGSGHTSLSGERNGHAKLSAAAVSQIRSRRCAGESAVALARQHGVTRNTIYDVCSGRSWKHLPNGDRSLPF